MTLKSGKGDALRKEKALLHTFVAGQKYGVRQYANGRFDSVFGIIKGIMQTKSEPGGRAPRRRLTLLLA